MGLHPEELFYADTHEWARKEGDGSIMDGGGMSEEKMRMILDELKQTRKDNEKLQDFLYYHYYDTGYLI